MPGVFISYSRKDQKIAETFERALKSEGVGVWRDQQNIYAGEKWPKAIGNAIAENQMLLLLWSPRASSSHFVEFEWNTALALQKSVLPVIIDNEQLPPALRALNGISAQDHIASSTKKIKEQLSRSFSVDRENEKEVLEALDKIESSDPREVIREANVVFKQKKWTIKGNVYQVSGGNININNNGRGNTWYRNGPIAVLFLIAIAVLTLLFMRGPLNFLISEDTISGNMQLTVYVHGPTSQQEVVLENTGALIVDFDNDRRRAIIGENGRTNFGEIPGSFRGRDIGIGLEAPGFEMVNSDLRYKLDGKPVYLAVKKDNALGQIKGIVKNRDGTIFIDNATVLIGSDTAIRTNELGLFNIVLPTEMQVRDAQTPYKLTIQKEGYQISNEYYYPLSGDIEIRLVQ